MVLKMVNLGIEFVFFRMYNFFCHLTLIDTKWDGLTLLQAVKC